MQSTTSSQMATMDEGIELVPTNYRLRINLEEHLEQAIDSLFSDPSDANIKALKDLFAHFDMLTEDKWRELGAYCKKLIENSSKKNNVSSFEKSLIEIYDYCIKEYELSCPISFEIFNEPVRFYSNEKKIWTKTYEKESIQECLDNAKGLFFRFPQGELSLTDFSYPLKIDIQNNLQKDKKKLVATKIFLSFWNATNLKSVEQYKPTGYIAGRLEAQDFYLLFEINYSNKIKEILEKCDAHYLKELLSKNWRETHTINHHNNLSLPVQVTRLKTFITYALEYNLDQESFKTLISRVKNDPSLKSKLISLIKDKEDQFQYSSPIQRLCKKSLDDKNSKDILLLLIEELPNETSELLSKKNEYHNPIFNTFVKKSIVTFQKISGHPEPIQAASFHHLLNTFTAKIDHFNSPAYQNCLENFKQLLTLLNDITTSHPDYFEQNLEALLQKSAKQMGGTFFFFDIPHDYTKAKQYLSFHSHDSLKQWLGHFKSYINQKSTEYYHEDSIFYNLFNELQTTLKQDTSLPRKSSCSSLNS